MTPQELMTLATAFANLLLKSTNMTYKKTTHSWLSSCTATSTVNMPRKTNKRIPILDFFEEFKQKHKHLTFKPPRAKKDRIHKIKNEIPELSFLYEYTEPIKVEPNDYSKLKNEFERNNNTQLGSRFTFEFGRKLGLPFLADGELYSPINPVGKKYVGIIQNMETGQLQEIDLYIMPH